MENAKPKKMQTHKPHPYRTEENSAEILKGPYKEEGHAKCPILNCTTCVGKRYIGTYVDYRFKNKKKQWVNVEKYCLLVEWLD